jgi:2-dehydro-3-deoxygalactonokinase
MNRIVVDWGTSSFRAYRFAADGTVADRHASAAGILSIAAGGFEEALRREIGAWLAGGADILLSGMITSRNGWVETPYIETPCGLGDLASGVVQRDVADGVRLSFLPGVCQRAPTPDVMRGEEIQVFGVLGARESGTAVLPGTHSKWVRLEAGRIAGFRSFMTGEVYGALRQHTILGRLIPEGEAAFDQDAFLAGIRQAADPASPGLLGDIFSVRSGVLLEAFAAGEAADRLSGLVIGHEIAGAARLGWTGGTVRLIGAAALCARYAAAFDALGIAHASAAEDAAVQGFRRLAAL